MKEEIEIRTHFRNTFFTPSGKEVLKHIMKNGYFFNSGDAEITANMPEAIGKRNLVNYILDMLGCIDIPEKNYDAIIASFEKVPIMALPKKDEEEENL